MRTVAATAAAQTLTAEALASNAVIARGLKNHDAQLLDLLIEQYQHRLLRYLLFLTGQRDLAEDLFQETWMRVLTRGTQYDGRARFDTWLFTIARNLVIDNSRKRRVASLDEMTENSEDAQAFEIASNAPSPLDHLRAGEQHAQLAEVLLQLDSSYREVLTLRFHEEMSLDEIAAVTRAPLSTVKSRLYRGLAALRPHLESIQHGEAQ
jgi:RNA polymerase sigma-70 factor (ECF subfamily)